MYLSAVVKDLSVYGVKNLKLADLKIPPEGIAANRDNTALLAGRKAKDTFIRELGLEQSPSQGTKHIYVGVQPRPVKSLRIIADEGTEDNSFASIGPEVKMFVLIVF
ncbi:hypothetical protein RRF57_000657 [Xylaria bambusicola]|uniref:Uncharacterized protein n=1 Tax=Xylaria bambusicola TaxID=326684 RepID=A0AAN7UEQ0_9PEZI